jgi:hypothetical protein
MIFNDFIKVKSYSPTATSLSLFIVMGSFFLDLTNFGVEGGLDVDFGGRHRSQYLGWDG